MFKNMLRSMLRKPAEANAKKHAKVIALKNC
jgi:hypothetical protein